MEKIRGFEAQGFAIDSHLNEDSSLHDLERANAQLYAQRKRKITITAMGKSLITLVAGIETMAGYVSKKTQFKLRLEGLSDSVSEDMTDYEPALSELYELHSEKLQISPWMGIAILLFHAAKTQHKRNLDKDVQFQMEKLQWERNFAMEQLRKSQPPTAGSVAPPAPPPPPPVSTAPSASLLERINRAEKWTLDNVPVVAPTASSTPPPPAAFSSPASQRSFSPSNLLSPSVRKDKNGKESLGFSLKDVPV
jgi:hypothetical protein